MIKKKLLTTFLTASLVTAIGSPVFADTSSGSVMETPTLEAGQTIDLQNGIENLPDGTVISEVLTFDQLMTRIAKDQKITEEEATANFLKTNPSAAAQRSSSDGSIARLATYRTFSVPLEVKVYYRPTLNFYCETSEAGGFHGISRIAGSYMNLESNGLDKKFSGNILINLENSIKIHYSVNGSFYNQGQVTFSLSGEFTGGLQVGTSGTLSASVSFATDYFGAYNMPGDFFWY